MLHFVENTDQIIENIKTIEQYLNSAVAEEKQFAQDLIKKGRSMVIYKVGGTNHFAPSSLNALLRFQKPGSLPCTASVVSPSPARSRPLPGIFFWWICRYGNCTSGK